MILHNLSQKWAKNLGGLNAGVYRLKAPVGSSSFSLSSGIEFVRPGYKLRHLFEKGEFLVTEGVPFKKSHFSPNRRLVRIVTLERLLDVPPRRLAPWAYTVARLTYKALDMRPIRFIKFFKLLNPKFLAKG